MITIGDFNALKNALESMQAQLAAENVPEEAVFDSRVVVHELVMNALVYGGGRAHLSYEKRGEEIRIAVRGDNSFRPAETPIPRADVNAERGRGLFLVDALSIRRGYSEEEGVFVFIKIEK